MPSFVPTSRGTDVVPDARANLAHIPDDLSDEAVVLCPSSRSGVAQATSSAEAVMHVPTVLVVDGEELIRWSLADRLGHEGYRVLGAETAAGAIERHSAGADPVLIDFRLPDAEAADDFSIH